MGNLGKILGSGLLVAALTVGCSPDEDTSPSAALFPTTYYGEVRPDFSRQLAARAQRGDAELHALLGVHYSEIEKDEIQLVREGLATGFYEHPQSGKKIYRIQSIGQARQILGEVWPEEEWAEPGSELASQFQVTPNASIAIMGQNDQRILFFDHENHLSRVYPEPG
jgi:hypothetical protein